MRVGWVEAAPAVLERMVLRAWVVSSGGPVAFAGRVLLHAMRSGGLARHVAATAASLAERCHVLCRALAAAEAEAGWTFTAPQGGYFLWLRLPPDLTSGDVVARARRHQLLILDGARCNLSFASPPSAASPGAVVPAAADDGQRFVRLCFANVDAVLLQQGAESLRQVVRELRAEAAHM